MDSAYLDSYGGLLLMFILAAGLAGVLVVASTVVGKHKHSKEKDQAYECGMAPHRRRAPAFLCPLLHGGPGLYPLRHRGHLPVSLGARLPRPEGVRFVEMLLYIIILLVGYIFLWKKGALDWD
jgi:NADH-quinone oxidoreductase subunit A